MSMFMQLKRLFTPVLQVPKSYGYYMFCRFYEIFQVVFFAQAGFYIIQSIEGGDKQGVIFWGTILGLSLLLRRILRFGFEVVNEYLKPHLYFFIKKNSLKQFLLIDNNVVESLGVGKIQSTFEKGLSAWRNVLLDIVVPFLIEIGGIIYASILIISELDDKLYLYGFFLSLAMIFFTLWKGLKALDSTRKRGKAIQLDLARKDVKFIMSRNEIIQQDSFDGEMDQQYSLTKEFVHIWQRGNIRKGSRQTIGILILNSLEIFVYIVLGIQVINGQYDLAYLVLLLSLLRQIYNYIRGLRLKTKLYMSEAVHLQALRDLLDKPSMQNYDTGDGFIYRDGRIWLSDISFHYDESKKSSAIFTDFSLDISGGEKIALVGPSGGGKSTLVKLIAGYLRPTSGAVLVDNQNLNEIALKSYYPHVGYLTQEPSVFDGTIRENLEYGMSVDTLNSSDRDRLIEEAIANAQCQFIYELSDGVDTEIGERGIRLSGGQRQRLAIAKIFLKDPEIIILDEPTSALDSESEAAVTLAMNRLFEGRTVIVIAHRLQTVKHADQIVYIQGGHIVEQGSHDQLMKLQSKYYNMVELQSGF